jgi:hypothetical protein
MGAFSFPHDANALLEGLHGSPVPAAGGLGNQYDALDWGRFQALLADDLRALEDLEVTRTSGAHEAVTVSVAASNTVNGASRANYVATGTNDHTLIQSAIDFVRNLGGGRVILLEGTFKWGSSSVNVWTGVVVEGQGDGTLLTKQSGVTASHDFFYLSSDISGGSTTVYNAQLRSFKIDGNWSGGNNGTGSGFGAVNVVPNGGNSGSNCLLHDLTVTNVNTGSLTAGAVHVTIPHTTVSNVRVNGSSRHQVVFASDEGLMFNCRVLSPSSGSGKGIQASGTRAKIWGNYVEGPTGTGGAILDIGTIDGIVFGNTVKRNGGSAGGYSLKLFGATGTTVIGNQMFEAYSQNDADDTIWIGNYVDIGTNTDVNQVGFMWGGTRGTFIGNTAKNARVHGIYLIRMFDSIVQGNVSINASQNSNNGSSGIMLWFQVRKTLIIGNTVRSTTANKVKYAIEEQTVSAPDQNNDNIILLNNITGSGAVTGDLFSGGTATITDFNSSGAAGVTKVGAIAVSTYGAVTAQIRYALASANGSATTPSRSDHVHGTPEPTILNQGATADYTVTNAQADVTGATASYTTSRANVKAVITVTFDVDITTSGTGLLTGQVLVDGAAQTPKVVINDPGAVDRRSGSITTSVVLATAASHTIKLQIAKANAGGTAVAKQDNTRVTVTIYD